MFKRMKVDGKMTLDTESMQMARSLRFFMISLGSCAFFLLSFPLPPPNEAGSSESRPPCFGHCSPAKPPEDSPNGWSSSPSKKRKLLIKLPRGERGEKWISKLFDELYADRKGMEKEGPSL